MLRTIGWRQSRCWEGTRTGLALHKQSQAGQSGTLRRQSLQRVDVLLR